MTRLSNSTQPLATAWIASLLQSPWFVVVALSVVIGFVMVIVFRYTSDQKAIGRAKDQLKAHLLAVRLFQDQLPVVVRAYGRILLGTGRYLRLAFTPFLIAIIPITVLIIQIDRYLGWTPLKTQQPFLVEARVDDPDALSTTVLQLPEQIVSSAPAVHVPATNDVVWRLMANQEGRYTIHVLANGQAVSKQVVVSNALDRVSPVRLRNQWWDRMLSSSEAPVPSNSPVQSVSVLYPARDINVGPWQMNWIVLFFILSLIAGYIFKTALGIQI